MLQAIATIVLLAVQPADPKEYAEFGKDVGEVVAKMKEVATGDREQSDLRALEFLMRGYKQAVSSRNWADADVARAKMRVYLTRGYSVASDYGRRKAELARADAERRHNETLEQRERQHKEAMKQQKELIDLIRRTTGQGKRAGVVRAGGA